MSAPDAEADIWHFVVRLYGQDGVAPACLRLQEEYGVDVALLLFAAWMAEQGVALTHEQAQAACGWVAGWHNEVVRSLRALRTRLKTGTSLAPFDLSDDVRNSIKRVELDSERAELAWLARESMSWRMLGATPVAALANLRLVFDVMTGSAAVSDDLGLIAARTNGKTP